MESDPVIPAETVEPTVNFAPLLRERDPVGAVASKVIVVKVLVVLLALSFR